MNWYVLIYNYVSNAKELRSPFRENHLKLVNGYVEKGEITLAGAWKNPLDGAAFIFKCDDQKTVKSFIEEDPYVLNGIVTDWQIKEWTVVAGTMIEG